MGTYPNHRTFNGVSAQNKLVHAFTRSPLELRQEIVAENWDLAKERLTEHLRPGPECPACKRPKLCEQWPVRTVFEVAGTLGPALVQNILIDAGVRSPEELSRYVQAGKRLELAAQGDPDIERTYLLAIDTLEKCHKERPELAARTAARFGSIAEIVEP